MSGFSQMLVILGLVSLFHALVAVHPDSDYANSVSAYSAHEFSAIATKIHVKPDLPLDIKLETLTAVFLACFGLVLGSEPLKPIAWKVWAGNVEKAGGAANPFRVLEDRPNFLDIRAKRREFAEWARDGETAS